MRSSAISKQMVARSNEKEAHTLSTGIPPQAVENQFQDIVKFLTFYLKRSAVNLEFLIQNKGRQTPHLVAIDKENTTYPYRIQAFNHDNSLYKKTQHLTNK